MSIETDAKPRRIIDNGFLFLITATSLAAVLVTIRHGPVHMVETALGALGFLALLLPKIACGVFISAAIPILVPRDRIARWIGRDSGLKGLAAAMLAGAVLPGGPSMTFPLTASLMFSGADIGASLSFVTGWSLFNLNRTLIWELSFLPPEFVGLRVLLCLPVPILVGLAARRLIDR